MLVVSRGTFRPHFPLNLLRILLAVRTRLFGLNRLLASLVCVFLCLNIFLVSSLNWIKGGIFFSLGILDDTVVVIICFVQNDILDLKLMV